jgi:hypothetical protein
LQEPLTFVRYGDEEELARRAALALDHSRLYREALAANQAKADFPATISPSASCVVMRPKPQPGVAG